MQRYSKKRQAILDCLAHTTSHPTAEWIYETLKPAFPDLSLATVYRNLSQLKEDGKVISMGTVLGQEHFDAAIHPHNHVICSECGKIIDIDVSVPDETIAKIRTDTGFEVRYSDIKFSGVCEECLKKKNGNK